jgi:hypothetical protein
MRMFHVLIQLDISRATDISIGLSLTREGGGNMVLCKTGRQIFKRMAEASSSSVHPRS